MSHKTHKLTIDGANIAVMEAGSGPPLLMLHGAGMADAWLPAYDTLAEHYRLLVPNHPGFGGSDDVPGVEAIDDLAYYYDGLLTTLGLPEKINVVGVSFGGWIAAELAVLAPYRIDKLALLCPIGLRVEGAPIIDSFALDPPDVPGMLFHDPAIAASMFPAAPDIDFLVKMYRDEASFAKFAWAPFCNNPKLPRRLKRIDAQTLVLWGDSDRLVPVAHGVRYTELIKNSQLKMISGAGHALLMERPKESTAALLEFLNS